ncbi:hypothetical protein IWQ61_002344 [Dispira simplex]|nr:hypothetical protein IWQ61_002344 [Dispira simplex]
MASTLPVSDSPPLPLNKITSGECRILNSRRSISPVIIYGRSECTSTPSLSPASSITTTLSIDSFKAEDSLEDTKQLSSTYSPSSVGTATEDLSTDHPECDPQVVSDYAKSCTSPKSPQEHPPRSDNGCRVPDRWREEFIRIVGHPPLPPQVHSTPPDSCPTQSQHRLPRKSLPNFTKIPTKSSKPTITKSLQPSPLTVDEEKARRWATACSQYSGNSRRFWSSQLSNDEVIPIDYIPLTYSRATARRTELRDPFLPRSTHVGAPDEEFPLFLQMNRNASVSSTVVSRPTSRVEYQPCIPKNGILSTSPSAQFHTNMTYSSYPPHTASSFCGARNYSTYSNATVGSRSRPSVLFTGDIRKDGSTLPLPQAAFVYEPRSPTDKSHQQAEVARREMTRSHPLLTREPHRITLDEPVRTTYFSSHWLKTTGQLQWVLRGNSKLTSARMQLRSRHQ